MMLSAVTLLPQPDSPDHAERLALVDVEVDAVDGADHAPSVKKCVFKIPHVQERHIGKRLGHGLP